MAADRVRPPARPVLAVTPLPPRAAAIEASSLDSFEARLPILPSVWR